MGKIELNLVIFPNYYITENIKYPKILKGLELHRLQVTRERRYSKSWEQCGSMK
jgi:hypothetical protein